jgi:hypothetical protein
MKKFPTIKISDDEPPSPPESPNGTSPSAKAERKTEEDIFVSAKVSQTAPPKKQKSAKQLAHLETIRAKALKARQDKAKAKKGEAPAEPKPAEEPKTQKPSADARRGDSAVRTYTHEQVEDIIRKTATGIYEKEKEKRIAEVRNKQAELEKKSFDINNLLRKGGRTRW